MSLNNKVALVTGGAGALGSVIAQRLATEGARVFVASRQREVQRHRSDPPNAQIASIKADVTDEADVVRLYDEILAASGHIDIVVNAVGGFLPEKPLEDVSAKEWDSMMNINLRSSFLSTREALRRMKGREYGRIINLSAMGGVNPTPGRAAYAISKAGVSILTEVVAREQKGRGITVNAIAPGIIATPANLQSMPGEDPGKWVKPEEIADLVCYLCSSAGSAISGTTIKVYGGV